MLGLYHMVAAGVIYTKLSLKPDVYSCLEGGLLEVYTPRHPLEFAFPPHQTDPFSILP